MLAGAAHRAFLNRINLGPFWTGTLIIEQVFPIEAIDEEMHLRRHLRMNIVIVHPIHQDLQAAPSKLGMAEHLKCDVCVDEGIEENVCASMIVGHDDLVYLTELLEDTRNVRIIQFSLLIGRTVGIGREHGHRDADDGEVVPITKPLVPKLIDKMRDEGLVIQQTANAGLLRLLAELGDLLIAVNLSYQCLTMEKTEEKRRLTVERFLSSEESAEFKCPLLMVTSNDSIDLAVRLL